MTDKERLINEWLEHDKIIIACDYDDTIFPWRHATQEQCNNIIKLVKWCYTIGAYIMIHTSSDKDRYEEIRQYCKKHGIVISSINENAIKLPYGKEGKPYYNWQLCDRSGLPYAYRVLEAAAREVITIKRSKINNNLKEIG